MAHEHVETNEGKVSGESDNDNAISNELGQWIISNNILSAKQKLIEKNVKLEELAELDPENAKEYAQKTLELDVIETNRFVKAISLLTPSKKPDTNSVNTDNETKSNDVNDNMTNSTIIVLSKEANDAINNIYNKKDEINEIIKNTLQNIDSFKQISERNKNAINQFRKEMIDKINKKMDELLLKSNTEIDENSNTLSTYLDLIQEYNETLDKTELEMNKLYTTLNATNIRTTKIIESKIIKLSKDALETEIIEPDIISKLNIEINKNKRFEYVNNIGNDNDIEYASDNTKEEKENVSQMNLNLNDFVIKFTDIENIEEEYFKLLGKETESSDNKKTITKLSNDYSSHFGNVCIKSIKTNIYVWDIKINKVNTYFAIGMSSYHDTEKNTAFYCDTKSSNYAYCDNGKKVSKNIVETYGKSWSDGDVIGIKLDEIQKNIQFFLNGEDQGVAYKNIDTGNDVVYKLAVHMYYKDSSVTIQKFECIN